MARIAAQEPVFFTEIGQYRYESPGEVLVTQESAVNEQLTPSKQATRTTLVGGVRVETTIKELKAVKDQQVYEKRVSTKQYDLGNGSGRTSQDLESDLPRVGNNDESEEGLSPMKVLKNFMDNIAADVRQFRSEVSNDRLAQWIVIAAALAIGLGGLILAIVM